MEFWTCQIGTTTRAFSSAGAARDYAFARLTVNGELPEHLIGPVDVHILYNEYAIARVQPLRLSFAGNPNGHTVIIKEEHDQ